MNDAGTGNLSYVLEQMIRKPWKWTGVPILQQTSFSYPAPVLQLTHTFSGSCYWLHSLQLRPWRVSNCSIKHPELARGISQSESSSFMLKVPRHLSPISSPDSSHIWPSISSLIVWLSTTLWSVRPTAQSHVLIIICSHDTQVESALQLTCLFADQSTR